MAFALLFSSSISCPFLLKKEKVTIPIQSLMKPVSYSTLWNPNGFTPVWKCCASARFSELACALQHCGGAYQVHHDSKGTEPRQLLFVSPLHNILWTAYFCRYTERSERKALFLRCWRLHLFGSGIAYMTEISEVQEGPDQDWGGPEAPWGPVWVQHIELQPCFISTVLANFCLKSMHLVVAKGSGVIIGEKRWNQFLRDFVQWGWEEENQGWVMLFYNVLIHFILRLF